jgi:hypothetical protein
VAVEVLLIRLSTTVVPVVVEITLLSEVVAKLAHHVKAMTADQETLLPILQAVVAVALVRKVLMGRTALVVTEYKVL